MPEFRDATAMLTDAFRAGDRERPARLIIAPEAYELMRETGRYLVRGDMEHYPLEYITVFGDTVMVYGGNNE